MSYAPNRSPTPSSNQTSAGCLLAALAVLVVSLCGVVTLIVAAVPLFNAAGAGIIAMLAASAVFALLFLVALAITRAPRMRAALHAWLLALPLTWVMIPAALLPSSEAQIAAGMRVVLMAAYLGALWVYVRRYTPATGITNGWVLAIGAAALLALPWLAWGALGSLLDLLLGLIAAVLFGTAAALLVARVYLRPLPDDPDGPGLFVGGTVIGVLLLVLGWNIGVGGQMLLLLPLLPTLGWLAGAVAGVGRGQTTDSRALLLFVALAVAPPLLFADPDTLHIELLEQGREGIAWALSATGLGTLLALALSGVAPVLRQPVIRAPRVGIAGAATLWLTGIVVYVSIGQPGLYGDRLFVILKDQADLSAAASIEDYQVRRRAVYETLVRHADVIQADLRSDLTRFGVWHRPYYLMNAMEVEGSLLMRLWLTTRPEVDRVVPNPVLRPLPEPLAVEEGSLPAPDEPLWNLTMINAGRVWEEVGVRGKGVVVGLMDSGVQWDHPELRDSYRGLQLDGSVTHEYNWYDPWGNAAEPLDYNGHGTFTLSAVVGNRVGVAPDATWIACVNLGRNVGNAARYLDCMQFMLAPFPPDGDPLRDGDPARGADITNNSWGCPQDLEGCDPNTLLPAAEALRAAGMMTIAAAGNDGPACSSLNAPLALYDAVVTVGAVDRSGVIAPFSSIGPVMSDGSGRIKPDIAAPGVDVLAAAPGSSYVTGSGTSIAAPHVTGVVALMWSAQPALIGDVARTEEILRTTAQPVTPEGAVLAPCSGSDQAAALAIRYGAGIVDAYRAVRAARAI
ncbi:S8 family serine peptidase [Roseiflexus sp.]|uniref:S8 family serine peptidase n=1 Tax=Roseiflexus sp. TaxID=2562120 RepID=UPI00398B7680